MMSLVADAPQATDAGTDDHAYANNLTAAFSSGANTSMHNAPTSTADDTPFNMSPYTTALSGITSAFASFRSGKINQELDNFNANLARLQAQQAIQAGGYKGTQEEFKADVTQGDATASAGAQGLSTSSGTARLGVQSNRNVSAMNQLMIQTNARRAAYGYQVKAAGDTLTGDLADVKGRTGFATSLLYTGAQEELESDPRYQGFRGRGANIP